MYRIFFAAIFIFIFGCNSAFCSDGDKDFTLRFNKNTYHLLYSIKNNETCGYLNEYYKLGETYNIWSEMVAVHHFPNAYSPIDRIKDFKDYLSSMRVPSSLTFDDKKNSAMIDFVLITNNKIPAILEFNIFKYEKSNKTGSLAIQYTKRYSATNTLEVEQIKKEFERDRKTLINKVKHYNIPAVVSQNIDKCISSDSVKTDSLKNATQKEDEIISSDNGKINVISTDSDKDNINTCNDLTTTDNEQNSTEENDISINNTETDETSVIENTNTENEDNILQNVHADCENKIEKDTDSRTPRKNKKNKKNNTKNKIYTISNDKNEYFAKPQTKRELKKKVKQIAETQKQKQLIKEADKERIIKERAKKAQKKLREQL